MTLTLGITGMDARTEADLLAAFVKANARASGRWTLAGDDANVVVVDMDSLYGPMSWLRLHAAGKRVIGLTSMDRTQTDFRLPRPIDAIALGALLEAIADEMPGTDAGPASLAVPPTSTPTAALPAGTADSLSATEGPVAQLMATESAITDVDAPVSAIATPIAVDTVSTAAERPLAAWLGPQGLDRRARLQRDGGPVLLLDVAAGVWHGDNALKPLAGYFRGTLPIDAFESPSDVDWETEAASLGAAQPLARLHWFGGLLAGDGAIRAGQDPEGRFRLLKWPQTEREFPKHFRIATAMMKAAASVAEIASASGVGREEVADFINANLATGYAEPATGETAIQSPAPGGLFGRRRGR